LITQIYNAPEEVVEAIKVSLLSNRASSPNEQLEGKGWWGDFFSDVKLGSDLWRLERSVLSQQVLKEAETYAMYCLKWMIDRKVLKSIQVKAHAENAVLILEVRCVQI
jgi:phage gp46-like protein